MSNKHCSWGQIKTIPQSSDKSVHAAFPGRWSMDNLTPKAYSKTKSFMVSYSEMTIIKKNGKK